MRLLVCLAAIAGALLCAACDSTKSAQGGGSERGGYGKVKIGVPF